MTESNSSLSTQNRVLRIGMIGCGALGVVHAQRLSKLPDVQICAASDPDESALSRITQAIPSGDGNTMQIYPDYRDLLDKVALDAVCISSPNRWHVEQVLASLQRDLHVLCEKPLSMDPVEVQQVVDATQASGKTVAIAYQSRYRRDSRVLRRLLHSGRYGRITSVDIFACEDWITPNVGTWRHDPARCPGGYFADANGHQLDLLFWLTGMEGADIHATMETRGTPVPIVTWGEARLKPDIPFTFTFVGDARLWREEISIQTERADFLMRDTKLLWSDGSAPLAPFPEAECDPADLNQPELPDTAFVAALRGGPPIVSPPESVWPVLNFTLAALASANTTGN